MQSHARVILCPLMGAITFAENRESGKTFRITSEMSRRRGNLHTLIRLAVRLATSTAIVAADQMR